MHGSHHQLFKPLPYVFCYVNNVSKYYVYALYEFVCCRHPLHSILNTYLGINMSVSFRMNSYAAATYGCTWAPCISGCQGLKQVQIEKPAHTPNAEGWHPPHFSPSKSKSAFQFIPNSVSISAPINGYRACVFKIRKTLLQSFDKPNFANQVNHKSEQAQNYFQ